MFSAAKTWITQAVGIGQGPEYFETFWSNCPTIDASISPTKFHKEILTKYQVKDPSNKFIRRQIFIFLSSILNKLFAFLFKVEIEAYRRLISEIRI